MISDHEPDQNTDDEGSHSEGIAQTNEAHDEGKHEITQEEEEEETSNCEDSRCEVQQPSEENHPAISSGDLGQVVKLKAQRPLTDSEKLLVVENHFVPGKGYQFPSRTFAGRQRRFQQSWLDKYNGLVYSESENGAFCKYCVLFSRCEPRIKEFGILITRPLTNFKKAVDKLNEHFGSGGRKSHQAAVEMAMAFSAMMKKHTLSIDNQL